MELFEPAASGRSVSEEHLQSNTAHERPGLVIPRGAGATLLRALALGPRSVSELVEETGLSQPNVSNHLARLRERGLVHSHREGRQIIYQVATAALAHFVLSQTGTEGSEPRTTSEEVAQEFLEAVLTLREEEAIRVVDAALARGLGWKELYLDVFEPTLVQVGSLWEEGKLSVATEHLITGITLRLLHRLSMNLPVAPVQNAPTALVGCVEGELHTVGGRMAADFLLAQGWRVWYLNGLLPLEHLMEAVRRHLPDAIVLCISTPDHEGQLQRSIERLQRWRGEQPLPLIVGGGRYFAEERDTPGLDLHGNQIEEVTARMRERIQALRGE